MDIHCKFDELIDPNKLKNHPKNRNKHGQDQIEREKDLLLERIEANLEPRVEFEELFTISWKIN